MWLRLCNTSFANVSRFINSILAVLISYIANLGIPRSGEILRATTLSNYEMIPFEKLFGTIIAERLIDFIILLSLIFHTGHFQLKLLFVFVLYQALFIP